MLTVTPTAAEAIRGIVGSSSLPEDAGLRIAAVPGTPEGQSETGPGFELSVVDVPAEGDQVIDEGGAHVFVEQRAAEALDDMALDASVEGNTVHFALLEHADSSDEPPSGDGPASSGEPPADAS